MMKFRTEINVDSPTFSVDYSSGLFFIGSCFSIHIHEKLERLKFDSFSNPFGIVYNPISISQQIKRICSGEKYTLSDLRFHAERWYSFDHHSDFSFSDPNECLTKINERLTEAHKKIQTASVVFLTLGSSWAYYHESEPEKVVSNCHKIPGKEFTKKLLTIHEMVADLSSSISILREVNPQVEILFSISPVRHLSDGFFENQVSKGRLFDTIFQLRQNLPGINYFPAYELMHDDLRDYRFYNSDLVHPSADAVDYIWEKFTTSCIDSKAQKTIEKVEKVLKAADHRPFNPSSEAHQKFIDSTLAQIEQLQKIVFGNFDQERKKLNDSLSK